MKEQKSGKLGCQRISGAGRLDRKQGAGASLLKALDDIAKIKYTPQLFHPNSVGTQVEIVNSKGKVVGWDMVIAVGAQYVHTRNGQLWTVHGEAVSDRRPRSIRPDTKYTPSKLKRLKPSRQPRQVLAEVSWYKVEILVRRKDWVGFSDQHATLAEARRHRDSMQRLYGKEPVRIVHNVNRRVVIE